MSLLSLAAGALASGSVDDVSGTIDKPVYNLSGDVAFGSMRSPERGGAVGSALGAGTGVGGAGGNVGLGANTAANAGNALAALLGGESGNIQIGGTTANMGMLVQGITMGIQGDLQAQQSAQTLAAGRATAASIRQSATIQKLQDNRSRRALAAKGRAAAVAANTSAQIGGVANVIATEEGLAEYFENLRFFSSQYKANIVEANAQNQARAQAFSAGINMVVGTVLTVGAFA